MALPGVRTVIKDRFFTLSRTNLPDTVRVVVIGRRNNDVTDELNGDIDNPDPEAPRVVDDFTPFLARGEEQVINQFGEGSELHRGYLEATSGGAPRVYLISWGSTGSDTPATDSDLDGDDIDSPFNLAFDAAEAVQADIIVPWGRGGHPAEDGASPDVVEYGFRADNSSVSANSLVWRVANRCKDITNRSNPVFAVMGVTPFEGVEEIKTSDLSTHLEFSDITDRNDLNLNPYVAVVATELRPVGYPFEDFGWSNGAALYAGYLSNIDSEVAATGKRLFNVRELRYAPTRPQQQELIDIGLTPIGQNFSRQAVVVDALMFGPATSDFARLTTLRIVFDAIQLVRRVAENYVGFPATMHHRNALDTAIGSSLRGMLVLGALIDADYNISYAPRENKAIIDLVLTPAFEMRNIEIRVSVQL